MANQNTDSSGFCLNSQFREPSIDHPEAGHFIPDDRKFALKALQRFLTSWRNGVFVVAGDRGVGKTRLVDEAINSLSFRVFNPQKGEFRRKIIAFQVDFSTLGVPPSIEIKSDAFSNQKKSAKGSSAVEIVTLSFLKNAASSKKNEPDPQKFTTKSFKFDDKDFLLAIIRALVTKFSPHAQHRSKGEGLRTMFGFFGYYFSFPRVRCKWMIEIMRKRHDKWVKAGEVEEGLKIRDWPGYQRIILFVLLLPTLIAIGFYIRIDPPFAQILEDIVGFAVPSFLTCQTNFLASCGCMGFFALFSLGLSMFLMRQVELWPMKKQARRLADFAFAHQYQREEIRNANFDFFSAKNNATYLDVVSKILPWQFQKKWSEKAVFARDIPNMLHELEIFLFQLNRLGVEPVLVLDEMDKFDSGDSLLELVRKKAGVEAPWNPRQFITPRGSGQWKNNKELIVFFDVMLRFKESLGKLMPIIVIGGFDTAQYFQDCAHYGAPPATLAKGMVMLGPVSVNAWQNLVVRLTHNCPPGCERKGDAAEETDRPRELCQGCSKEFFDLCITKLPLKGPEEGLDKRCQDDQFECPSDDQFKCPSRQDWAAFTWIDGRGRYAEMLNRFRRYRNQQWKRPYADLQWAGQVAKIMSDLRDSDDNPGMVPGAFCAEGREVIVQSMILSMLFELLHNKPAFFPQKSSEKLLSQEKSSFVWNVIDRLYRKNLISVVFVDKPEDLPFLGKTGVWFEINRKKPSTQGHLA